jgi:hypothetical protein
VDKDTPPGEYRIEDPADYGHPYWAYHRAWAWIWINGYDAAYKCGDWHAKFYVKNPASGAWDHYYDDYFRIEENARPSVTVSQSPESPIELQSILLHVSSSDNNHLQKIVLHWNDGADHTQTWDNINASSYNPSHSIGSYIGDAQVEYWAEAWDESGNHGEGGHHTVTVVPEIVTIPDRPTGEAYLQVGQVGTYTTGGSTTSLDDSVEYDFDCNDGTPPNWGPATLPKSWSSEGYYFVRTRARCQTHTNRESGWSTPLLVYVDSTSPIVDINTNGGTDFETTDPNVVIEGNSTDPCVSSGLASVSINTGATNEGTFSNWRFRVDLAEGANLLTVTVTDNAGNIGQDTIVVTYTVPDIRIEPNLLEFEYSPAGGGSANGYNEESLQFEGLHGISANEQVQLLPYDEPQQSKTGPTPPPGVPEKIREIGTLAVAALSSVPPYSWRHGCGPTAVSMVVGYYDSQGYNDLITGDASTQTDDVNQAIASGGTSGSPYPSGSEQHYEDYSRPEDPPPGAMQTDDYITQSRIPHSDNCIGDYMDTSKSTRNNRYGWSWSSDVGPSFVSYVNQQNSSYNPTYEQYQMGSTLTWNILTTEIDNGRPMVFLVDTDADGGTDHFVTVVGYRDTPSQQYGCLDTWAPADVVRWCDFAQMSSGQPWGIWGGWSFSLAPPSEDSFTIYNDGTADLEVNSITKRDGDDWLVSWTPDAPFTIVPGGSQTVIVNIDGALGAPGLNEEQLVVLSNDVNKSPYPGGVYVNLTVTCDAPTITEHPTPPSLTICDGESHEYCVNASGTAPLSYQWQRDDSNIPGATSSCYTISPVGPGDVGDYTCVVSNNCGSVESNPATLTVNLCQYLAVIYVDANATAGANNGSSWADAFIYLQDALAFARDSGDVNEIRVAQGVYTPDSNSADPNGSGDRTATFKLVNGVALKGGYAGVSEPDPNARDIELYETILSGDLDGNDVDANDPCDLMSELTRAENSYHVITGSGTDSNAVLDGFTITAGAAGDDGGGMYNQEGFFMLRNCTFVKNTAESCGGALYNILGNPMITDCLFLENAAQSGGAICNAISNPILKDCAFSGNLAIGGGGALVNNSNSHPSFRNCLFIENFANDGGALRDNLASSAIMTNCTLSGNRAHLGGGIHSLSIGPVLANCVLWGNSDHAGTDEWAQIYGVPPSVRYSCVQGWTGALDPNGIGNISDAPLFVDPNHNDYHLLPGSPCIDAADNDSLPAETGTDLGGSVRFVDELCTADTGSGMPPIVDMGAYEYQGLLADLDNNCRVDFRDYAMFAIEWMNEDCSEPNWCAGADLDFDGAADVADLAIFTREWLVVLPVKLYDFNLDNNPGWSMEGEWAFGQPLGGGGSHGNPDPNSGYSGSNVYGVNLYGDYTIAVGGPYHLTAGPLDCSDYHSVHLKFARWLNTDTPTYVASKIEASTNGTDWSVVWEHTGSSDISDDSWKIKEYDISNIADNQDTVYLRWSYQILDAQAYSYSGWNIDNIELWGVP